MSASDERDPASGDPSAEVPPVTLTRTTRGWSIVSPSGTALAGDLVEGMTLADLVAEEFGALIEPDRTARRSARGPGQAAVPAADTPDGRLAALERTVAQLEHALAARVSTERAIGVLAERHRTSPRAAFDSLRREARSSGRPVAELAREVLATLEELPGLGTDAVAAQLPLIGPVAAPAPRTSSRRPAAGRGTPVGSPAVAAADGRS
ncbi:ANTAR domain-containing protein [Blastococcus sp. CT_GayMR19]|uniref:ANTAR domain-containing protein n=1 Tax=Blastococcus sp. CT_GayMR19 TaxID=2559608 RepID=UPI001FD86BA8|nr:ANTAR domain-containing protein [Blastococcus sp. CT_GayMR19]